MDLFSEVSNDVVEFLPNVRPKQYAVASTLTEPPPECVDKGTSGLEMSTVETQTISSLQALSITTVDEEKLLRFLRNITPLLFQELDAGLTPNFPDHELMSEVSQIDVKKHQMIQVSASKETIAADLKFGVATWLAISTQNAPALAVSVSPYHLAWCDHQEVTVLVFTPRRKDKTTFWEELKSLPVKACVHVLKPNPSNKFQFAAGTVSGDVYVWEHVGHKDVINEMLTSSTDNGAVCSIDWSREAATMLTCHEDGYVLIWKLSPVYGLLRKLKITMSDNLTLTTMVLMSDVEFVVGAQDGQRLVCTTDKSRENPVLYPLKRHEFSVQSLQRENDYLVSCDRSGTVFVQKFGDSDEATLQLPLDLQGPIVYGSMDFIFNSREVLQISNGSRKVFDADFRGGGAVALSGNGTWLVTGGAGGVFQIFYVE